MYHEPSRHIMAISNMDTIGPATNREGTDELFHILKNSRRRHVIEIIAAEGRMDQSKLVDRVTEREMVHRSKNSTNQNAGRCIRHSNRYTSEHSKTRALWHATVTPLKKERRSNPFTRF